jgi:hypothetical protein
MQAVQALADSSTRCFRDLIDKAPASDADASFVVSRDGETSQPGPAPCVAVYTA